MSARLVALALAALIISGCDNFYDVEYHNPSATRVIVYTVWHDGIDGGKVIDAGSSALTTWTYPTDDKDTRQLTVIATTESGVVVFCKTYSHAEIRSTKMRVNIDSTSSACMTRR